MIMMAIRLLKGTTVEVATLLERVNNRKTDSYVKLNMKMEDYYRIKDAEDGETDGQGMHFTRYCKYNDIRFKVKNP